MQSRRTIRISFLVGAVGLGAIALPACSHTNNQSRADHRHHASAERQRDAADGNRTPAPPPAPATDIEAKQIAAEEQASYVTEIKFGPGSATLNAQQQERLSHICEKARVRGAIAEVKVITWADQEYPSVSAGKLSDSQRQLAEHRNEEIKRFLHGADPSLVVVGYNMAERPNALSELAGTSNARIKRSLEVAGIPNTDTSVKSPAMASKAIAMVILKD